MKRNYILSAVFLLTSQITTTSIAGECINYTCQDSNIQSITVSRSDHIDIRLTDQLSELKCSAVGQTVQLTKKENPNFREQFTALLSSQKTKQPVNLAFSQSGSACVIDSVTVQN